MPTPPILVDPLPSPTTPDGVALLVHGGAWAIPDDALDEHRADLRVALEAGRRALLDGTAALDVVVEVVARLETSGTFDAGRGSVLTLDGRVEMDAACMDGAMSEVGSVIGIKKYPQPIHIAHALLRRGRGETRMLAGAGAEAFAAAAGFAAVDPAELVHPRERERHAQLLAEQAFMPSDAFLPRPRGTVGCVARDRAGRFAAATSTGGTPLKPPGRVGDSPLPGSGLYASAAGAVSCTGWGEALLSRVTALRALMAAEHEAPADAARHALADLYRHVVNHRGEGGTGGLILLTPRGGVAAYTTPRMARAGWVEGGDAFVQVS